MRSQLSFGRQALISLLLIGGGAVAWIGPEQTLVRLGLAPEPPAAAASEAQSRGRGGGAVAVAVAEVGEARDDILFEAIGTGRARRTATLRPDGDGKVIALALAGGARFQKGDVLLKLDSASAQLAAELAAARLEDAQRTLRRQQQLQGRGAAAEASLDAARTAATVAEIELRQAQQTLEDQLLRAPFDGVSAIPQVDIGDWIDEDDVIAQYDDRAVLFIEIDVPETLLPRLSIGMAAEIATAAAPDTWRTAAVAAIDSRLDPVNRAARVRVEAPNPEDDLRPGGAFTVRLSLSGAAYPTAPELALQFSREGMHVWRIADETAERVPVRLVRRRADSVLIAGDLSPGDKVVVEGARRLSPGKKVKITQDLSTPES